MTTNDCNLVICLIVYTFVYLCTKCREVVWESFALVAKGSVLCHKNRMQIMQQLASVSTSLELVLYWTIALHLQMHKTAGSEICTMSSGRVWMFHSLYGRFPWFFMIWRLECIIIFVIIVTYTDMGTCICMTTQQEYKHQYTTACTCTDAELSVGLQVPN